ncbi:MAG: hypothetical protein L0241_32525, partial [Planctomycetia bacterium]|nr:hypothetical protein [Planctomycetia bacterium]
MANASQASGFSSVAAGLGASERLAKNYRYVYENFARGGRVVYTDGVGGTAAVTDAALNVLVAPSGQTFEVRLEQAFAGAAPQVLMGPDGLVFVLDAAATDGIALSLGNGAAAAETPNKGKFTIGQDAAFFFRAKV